MAESERPTRDLNASLSFCTDDLRSGLELVHCWPEPGDTLLREPVGDEAYIYPLTAWVKNDLERLNYYALQYHGMARELTKLWIQHHRRQPENWIYVIGFLLRHTIELRIKAAITRTAAFTALDLAGQRKMLWVTHNIRKLWNQLELDLPILSKPDAPLLRGLIYELDDLDRTSDGFRYPFQAEKNTGARIEAKASLSYVIPNNPSYISADNLIWVLEGVCNWLSTLEDSEEAELDALQHTRKFEPDAIQDDRVPEGGV